MLPWCILNLRLLSVGLRSHALSLTVLVLCYAMIVLCPSVFLFKIIVNTAYLPWQLISLNEGIHFFVLCLRVWVLKLQNKQTSRQTTYFNLISVKPFYLLFSIIKNKISSCDSPYFFCVRQSNQCIVVIIITLSVVIFLIMCVFITVLNICYLVDFSPI